MAEYLAVIQTQKRMCADRMCSECPLGKAQRGDMPRCGTYMRENPEEAERIIMDWGEVHPEAVYPTWGEWWDGLWPEGSMPAWVGFTLVLPDGETQLDIGGAVVTVYQRNDERAYCTGDRIPADIAAMLGVEAVREGGET